MWGKVTPEMLTSRETDASLFDKPNFPATQRTSYPNVAVGSLCCAPAGDADDLTGESTACAVCNELNSQPSAKMPELRTRTCAISSRSSGAFSLKIALAVSVLSSPVARSTNDRLETGTLIHCRAAPPKGGRGCSRADRESKHRESLSKENVSKENNNEPVCIGQRTTSL